VAVSAPGAPTARPIDAVIKLGGDVLEGEALADAAAEIARARAGRRLLVVHGGGPQVTALARRLGVEANIVGGRRITDDPMLAIVKRVISGLNVDLVAALRADGVPAFGVSGASGVIRAHRRPPRVVSGAGDAPIDFGLVGDIDGFDVEMLDALDARDALPVLACLGADAGGMVLNINADVVASQLAAAVRAGALVACTSVGGVRRDKDDPATRLARLTVAEAKAAIADGTVQGGMIPKLEEAFAPLAAGVAAVHIVAPSEIATSLLEPGSVGTLLVP
jgi:acetylglutamate kinase